MAFPRDHLTDDEDLVLDLRPHWWFLSTPAFVVAGSLVFALLAMAGDWPGPLKSLSGILLLGSLIYFGITYLRWTTINFVVTSERVISRGGVISKTGIEIPLDRINTVFFNQSVFERMIGAGDIGIESAGEGGRQTFADIRKPNLVQNEIYKQAELHEDRQYQRMGQAVKGETTSQPEQPAPPPATPPSIPDQIERLERLRRDGALTDEEFQSKKSELLDRM